MTILQGLFEKIQMRKFSLYTLYFLLTVLSILTGCTNEDIRQRRQVSDTISRVGFVKGFSWGWTGRRGQYEGPEPKKSMQKLAETNATWVCLSFAAEMKTFDSPEILWSNNNPKMVTDDEIRLAIQLARNNNLKVIMKPVVNVRDGTWRAWIKFKNEDNTKDLRAWKNWWRDFRSMLLHYAEIAQQTNCEILCLGCEMEATEDDEKKWRNLIADIRKVYSGAITYNANWGREDKIVWWDALDVISISAYYPVGSDDCNKALDAGLSTVPVSDSTVEAIKKRWQPIKENLAALSTKYNRPILFIELGVCSAKGFSAAPWTHYQPDSLYDGDEQRRFYQATMETFWDEPWFMGFAWWAWLPQLYTLEEAKSHTGFCIYGKPAEKLVTEWYAKPGK